MWIISILCFSASLSLGIPKAQWKNVLAEEQKRLEKEECNRFWKLIWNLWGIWIWISQFASLQRKKEGVWKWRNFPWFFPYNKPQRKELRTQTGSVKPFSLCLHHDYCQDDDVAWENFLDTYLPSSCVCSHSTASGLYILSIKLQLQENRNVLVIYMSK